MTMFRATGRAIWTIKVPTKTGEWLPYSTGTKHQATARRIERMIEHLGPRGERAWDVIDQIHDGTRTIPQLFDSYCGAEKDVIRLRIALKQSDLGLFVQSFLESTTCTADTRAHYEALLRRLIPDDAQFAADEFTPARLQRCIDEMEGSPATKRKAGSTFRVFAKWLIRRGVIRDDPMRAVVLPKAPPPRTMFLETADAIRLADQQPSPYREFSAFMAGSGVEVSIALALTVRDVDIKHREVRAKGTKTHARDRVVRVADWAWPYLQRAMKGKKADDRLFAGIVDRWTARDVHSAAAKELAAKSPVFDGYTMRDHRHTYAVRAIRAGTPADLVARQLGHANPILVLSVYGRFQPSQDERSRWERAATAMDRSRGKGRPRRKAPQRVPRKSRTKKSA